MSRTTLRASHDCSEAWRRVATAFGTATALLAGALCAFVLALDPYGLRTSAARRPTPIMDLNQRYMYPQLARSGLFDAAIFGSSTIRLLDPVALGRSFGGRFANLGMNAATPWEQLQLARLFLRHVPSPRMLIFGLDRTWCDPEADRPEKRLTARSFPPWLYEDGAWPDPAGLFNLRSVEIASRVLLNHLGLMPDRIRGDGYEVFLPPESRYDPARANAYIRGGGTVSDEVRPTRDPEGRPGHLPALAWLDDAMSLVPAATRVAFVLPPVHVAAQAAPGTGAEQVEAACKARLREIALAHGAALLDFRVPSTITGVDANYWDRLHYRLPIADRIVSDIREGMATGHDAPDGDFRVLAPGRPAGR